MRCFVPNCENTVGVPFPVEYELQNTWLKNLQITDAIPDSNSFICLDHFAKDDVEDIGDEDGIVEKRIREGALPRLFFQEDTIEKETEEFLEFRSPKIINSTGNSQEQSSTSDLFEPLQEEPVQPEKEIEEVQPDQEAEPQQPEFVPQFQQFQDEDLVLEQQDYSETQSSSQSFPSYSQDGEVDKNQEQEVAENSSLIVPENQSFFTVQHEFATQEDESQVYTSEGQPVQIFTSQDQTIYTAEGQPLYVTDGQPVLTQEGHEVFESQEAMDQDQSTSAQQSFGEEQNFSENDGLPNIEQVQGGVKEEITEDGQPMTSEQNIEQDLDSEEQTMHLQESDTPNESAPVDFHEQMDPNLEQHFLEQKVNIESDAIPQGFCETAQDPNDGSDQQQIHLTETSTPPENIVMQWFVPNQPVISTPMTQTSEVIGTDGDKKRITITYPKESSVSKNVPPQPIFKTKSQDVISPVKIQRKAEVDKTAEDACRLCMSKDQVSINILDNIKNNIMVLEAIQLCIHPLEVSLEDPFSKKICIKCFNLLQKYFDFRQNCLKIDVDQRRAYEKAHPLHRFLEKRKPVQPIGHYPRKTHMKTIISPSKVGYRQTEVVTVLGSNSKGSGVKNVSRKVILTPTIKKKPQSEEIQYLLKDVNSDIGPNEKCVRQIISKVSKADDIQVFKLKKSSPQNGQSYPTKYAATQKTPAVPISISPRKIKASQIEALARKPPLPAAKQMKIQEELKKVIEGTMSKDDLSVDHVIVRVVSDDETEENMDHFPAKRKKFSVPGIGTLETKQEFSKMKIGRNEVLIPKGIRVSIPDTFESSKGIFPCFPKIGAFGTEFTLVDGYLFEHRLCKGKERYLKCVAVTCPAQAYQKLLSNGKFENRALVKIPHNHLQLTTTEIKKQMFYYVMKKKMQADRGLNFRNIYDQICEKDPEVKNLVPLRNLINEICKHQLTQKMPQIKSFDDFYNYIEDDTMQKLQFTYGGKQFYQERFTVEEEGTKAVVFANVDTIKKVSNSKLMYVDASFRIDTGENFSYQLVTVLVWIDDSYYPIMFALVSDRTMEIFKKVFSYLHDTLAPDLCPEEIVTDYEANIYYALGETYLESPIGGSVFYYTQNLYKKICELGLSKELETTAYFRNIYHMLLMLPLLPVNTIMDGLQNIEIQANDLGVGNTTAGLFEHIKEQWMERVTPDLFCVHRLENRINENVIAPFKKLRDFMMLNKGKTQRQTLSIVNVVEKLIDLENFLQTTYSSENKKSFGRDLSSLQKKNVLKAWQYIETHPKININHFFTKVIGYIKCMENQLWIWGYYKFSGRVTDDLINAANFSIVNTNEGEPEVAEEEECGLEEEPNFLYTEDSENTVVVEAVVGPSGEFVISNPESTQEVDSAIFKYVYKNNSKQ